MVFVRPACLKQFAHFTTSFFNALYALVMQEPVKSRAPQLHLEYRFYKSLGTTGKGKDSFAFHMVFVWDSMIWLFWKARPEDCIISTTSDYCTEVYILTVICIHDLF